MLALLTSRSIDGSTGDRLKPATSPAAATRRRRWSGSAMSPAIAVTPSRPPTARSSASPPRASTTRLQPRSDRARVRARPRPREAPVTMPCMSGPHARCFALDDAVVVEAQQLDHVEAVVLVLDPARREPGPPGEDRVILDPALLLQ